VLLGRPHPSLRLSTGTVHSCLPHSVIGLSDGLTVPFALAAGLSSLGESKLVVLGGIAELIAGAISMGIGGFLASQAERDHHRYLRRTIKARVQRCCDGEMEREVHAVLGAVGVDEKVSRQVAHNLLEVESATATEQNGGSSPEDEERGLRWSRSVGITEFLLKFGQGLGAFTLTFVSSPTSTDTHVRQRMSLHAASTCLQSRSV
jgi:vacuolar iron transporter family protein